MHSTFRGYIRAIALPICSITVAYIVASMILPNWPVNIWAISFLTLLGFVGSGWAAFRLKRQIDAPFFGAALAAFILAIAHFSIKRAFFLALTNLNDYPLYLSAEMVMMAVVLTSPFTVFSGWLGVKLARRGLHPAKPSEIKTIS